MTVYVELVFDATLTANAVIGGRMLTYLVTSLTS